MKKVRHDYKLLSEIFTTFFKISPLTFGGGFAMIPILETEMVEKKKWIEREKIVDVFAVSQSVPGAIAINAATFLGYQIAGIPGALAAMLGMLIPTFVIIILLGILFISFQGNMVVQAAMKGIRPVIVALIAAAAFKIGKTALSDKICWLIFISVMILLLLYKNLNLVLVILLGGFMGVMIVKITNIIRRFPKRQPGKKSRGNKPGGGV